ncbi:MAG TPA: hypothetical protein VFT71_08765 [Candidatus Nitrosocosmicus sp.]|nr:hypothetical protein [Candidatus Nitrosocosmicus sp.]
MGNKEEKNENGLEKGNKIFAKIDIITRSSTREYYKSTLKKLANKNIQNAETICDFIIDEQNKLIS